MEIRIMAVPVMRWIGERIERIAADVRASISGAN